MAPHVVVAVMRQQVPKVLLQRMGDAAVAAATMEAEQSRIMAVMQHCETSRIEALISTHTPALLLSAVACTLSTAASCRLASVLVGMVG